VTLDLSNYPNMFVSDGKFNGYIVVGESSRANDILVVTDIASNMKIKGAETPTPVSVSGDAWKVGTGNTNLEVANSDAAESSIQGENLYDISRYIGKNELAALESGVYKARSSSYDYKQFLYFDIDNTGTNELVKYAQNEDGVTDLFFFIDSGKNIGQYKVEFSPSATSSIYDTAGSESSSGTVLRDFENTKINMLGKEFSIVLARRQKAKSVKLTLMGGAVHGSLLEGESQTYQLNGDDYEVQLIYVDGKNAKFSVNDEVTNTLKVGETYKLASGKEIGVSENLYQSYAGGVHSVDFFVGANKLIFRDDDITNTVSDNELVVSGKTIDGADVIITGTDDTTVSALSTIIISMTAQNDYYLGVNDKLSSVIESSGDDPRILFTNQWDIEFKGLSEAKSHNIELDPSGERRYKFVFYDGDGKERKI